MRFGPQYARPVEAMETLVAALRKHKTNDDLLSKLL